MPTSATHSLSELVRLLHALDPDAVTLDAVTERLAATTCDDSELRPYLHLDDANYTRNLVHRSDVFDVIVLCWPAGSATPIHDHSGQRGWVRVVRGALEETQYAPRGAPSATAEPGVDPCLHLKGTPLDVTARAVVPAGPAVATVDPQRAIHRIANPTTERAVSVHVYSRPHDSCQAFDADTGRVERRELRFDSIGPGLGV